METETKETNKIAGEAIYESVRNAVKSGDETVLSAYLRSLTMQEHIDLAAYCVAMCFKADGLIDTDTKLVEDTKQVERTRNQTVNDVQLPTKEDAEKVISAMRNIIKDFGCVSLCDFFDLVGIPVTHKEHRVGWYNLDNVGYAQSRRGWLIDFPPMVQL